MFVIDYNSRLESIKKMASQWPAVAISKEVCKSIPFPGAINPIASRYLKRYIDEIKVWEEYVWNVATANISYEIEGFLWAQKSLCSSASYGSKHYRTLDWDIKGLKKWETIKCINAPAGEFKMVGVPAMVGCLTGVAKGRFSISINADMSECHIYLAGTPIAILIRQALEECESFDEAVRFISSKRPMRSSFVHIVSPEGWSSIIHSKARGEVIAATEVTNHHPEYEFEDEFFEDSNGRLVELQKSYRNMFRYPVYSDQTMQFIVMDSKTGTIRKGKGEK